MSFSPFSRKAAALGAAATLSLVLLLLLAGCSSNTNNKSNSTKAASTHQANGGSPTGQGSAAPGSKGTPGSSATGGASKPTTTNEKWVSGLCKAAQGFADDIETLGKNFNPTSDMSSAQVKDLIVKFLKDADARAKKLRTDIDNLGNPDVKDGDKIETAFSAAAGKVVASFDDAVTATQKLDENDIGALFDGLTTVGDDLDSASSTIDDAFSTISNDYDTSTLRNISLGRPECAGVFD